MIATLPMYDFPALRGATDALWATIRDAQRAQGVDAPEALTRSDDLPALWRDPALLVGQTCGYPYWAGLRDKVEILATPVYGLPGCEGPNHCSFLVARHDDPRNDLAAFKGARAAVNSRDSNTGMNLFRAAVAPLAKGRPFFAEVIVTGAHAASLDAIINGDVEIAAIDCVTLALLAPRGVRIVARTANSPSLPFVASRSFPVKVREALRTALIEAVSAPDLGLVGFVHMPETAYARVCELEQRALKLGYPDLA